MDVTNEAFTFKQVTRIVLYEKTSHHRRRRVERLFLEHGPAGFLVETGLHAPRQAL